MKKTLVNTVSKVQCNLSGAKANRLFWLGRYAERVYTSLHLLRKHFDLMIDEDETAYIGFCRKMGISNSYVSPEDFVQRYLFDNDNPESVVNMLERVKDNAILLREELSTETLSYIELCITYMKSSQVQSGGVPAMQQITDYMLAFWGSLEERLLTDQIRHTIQFGKYMERMELLIRFEYPLKRVQEVFGRLELSIEHECNICDEITLLTLKEQLKTAQYPNQTLLYLMSNLSNV